MALYLTHPEVVIDPKVPTTRWGLSPVGRERLQRAVNRGIFDHITHIVVSTEQKAVESAEIIGGHLSLRISKDPLCNENERSSTGFISSDKEFSDTLTRLYEFPTQSASGWETADATQERIVKALDHHLERFSENSSLFVGHGTIGTLLKCHVGEIQLSRNEDQRVMAAPGEVMFFLQLAAENSQYGLDFDRRFTATTAPIEHKWRFISPILKL